MKRYNFAVLLCFVCFILLNISCTKESRKTNSLKQSRGSEVIERSKQSGSVRLLVQVSPAQPKLSDLIEVDLQVTYPKSLNVVAPSFGTAVGDFLVRDYSERTSAPSKTNDDECTRVFHYQLEPTSTGKHLIRSIEIEYAAFAGEETNGNASTAIASDPIELDITSEFGLDNIDLSQLSPMAPPRPLNSSSTWLLVVPVAIAIGLVLLFVFLHRNRKNVLPAEPVISPGEIAERALRALLEENLPGRGLNKEFYLRLTGIVRTYIESTTSLKAPEQTTEEFLLEMKKTPVFSSEQSLRLGEFLESADMVKYAGLQPSSEQTNGAVERAKSFIELQPKTIEPPISNSESVLVEERK